MAPARVTDDPLGATRAQKSPYDPPRALERPPLSVSVLARRNKREAMSDGADPTTVKLKSKEDELFEVDRAVACRSATLAYIFDPAKGKKNALELKMIDSKVLSKVLEYCKYHHTAEAESRPEDVKKVWDKNFVKGLADDETLYKLMLDAARFLKIKPLLDLTGNTIADEIKGKRPEEIRSFLPEVDSQLVEWYQGFGTKLEIGTKHEIVARVENVDSVGFEAAKRTLRSLVRSHSPAWTNAWAEVTRTFEHSSGVHETVPCTARGEPCAGAESTFLRREGADGAVQAPAMNVAGVGELTPPMCEALSGKTVLFAVEKLREFPGDGNDVVRTRYEKRYVFEHDGVLSFELTHVKKGKGRLYLIEEATVPEYKVEIKFHCGPRPAGQPDPATNAWWYTDSMLLLVADLVSFSTRPNVVHYLEGEPELISLILSKLPPRDLARAARVCKAFRNAPFTTSKNAKPTTMGRLADMRSTAAARPAPPPRERPPSPPPPLYGLGYGDGPSMGASF